jgi:HSP20 family protein
MTRIRELIPWNRPSSLSALQEEMNQLFDSFFSGGPAYLNEGNGKEISAPAINIVENGDSFRVEAELPGMDPKNVGVEAANGCLTIRGERKEEKKDEGENYLRQEISCGSFVRTVALPETADSEKARATFRNGVLTLTVPKKPEAVQKPKKIEIKAAA